MGLDIYAHLVKSSVVNVSNNSTDKIYAELNKNAKVKYHKTTSKLLKELSNMYETCSPIEYAKYYLKFIDTLKRRIPLYKKYGWLMGKFGYDDRNKVVDQVKTPQEISSIFESEVVYAISNAYFRKVNFIYEYFREKLIDESCLITKNELNEFIQVCKDVYTHKGDEDYASENLPTTGGFFFGNTDYNDYYWEDVNDCIKQMQKIYKSMKEDDLVLWIFSW